MKKTVLVLFLVLAIIVSFSTSVFAAVIGDIDIDCRLSESDVAFLNRHLAGWNGYKFLLLYQNADVDGAIGVTVRDAIVLSRHLAQYEGYESLPYSNDSTAYVLDSGVCGENLTWALYSDGLLKISGYGRSYDYCKGLFGDRATKEEIEAYQKQYAGKEDADSFAKYERGFISGKTYDHKNAQYVAPWYKYRQETDFTTYTTKEIYKKDNPNGWTYNRIEVEPGITYLGDWLFYRVCGPTELIIPDTVTEIGRWCIRYSPTLKTVRLSENLTIIGDRGCSRLEVLEELETGKSLEHIGSYAFAQNSKLRNLIIDGDIKSFGTYSFGYNDSLECVALNNVSELARAQFIDCPKLKKVILPNNLETICESAFVNSSIGVINIPENVAEIKQAAFYNCTNLETVFIDSAVIASNLDYSTSCGHLISNAITVYIKEGINDIGSYLTKAFEVSGNDAGYIRYTKIMG